MNVNAAISSPRFTKILFWVSVAVLAAGLATLIVKLSDRGSHQAQAPSAPVQPSKPVKSQLLPKSTVHSFAEVEPGAKLAISKFILGAVAGKDLREAWRYIEPGSDLRRGYSLKKWMKGEIPVVPFPVYQFKKSNYDVVYGTSKQLNIDVALTPTPESGMRPTVFRVELHKIGKGRHARWLVDYWLPRYTPPIPINDQ
jgi:hypothetical protein